LYIKRKYDFEFIGGSMESTPSWLLVFNVIKDTILVFIAGGGLLALLYTKKQIDLIKVQTKETRNQFRIRNQRESISLAIELSEKFPNIIHRSDELRAKNQNNCLKYENLQGQFIDSMLSSKNCCQTISQNLLIRLYKLIEPVGEGFLEIANELEGIALYFVNGVADEKAVFTSLAPVYCSLIERNYPLMIMNRCVCCGDCNNKLSKTKYELYNNSFKLYSTWKSRILKEKNKIKIEMFANKQKELDSNSQSVTILGGESKKKII